MLYGASRTLPTPGARDICSLCEAELIAKCGDVVSWHWAHAKTDECDSWSEPITAWHLDWQNTLDSTRQEIILGRHRADMVLPRGLICEIQHSPISINEIQEREIFYDRMIWVIDAREPYRAGNFEIRKIWKYEGIQYASIYWKWKRVAAWGFSKDVYLDTGNEILKFEHFYESYYGSEKFKFKAQVISRKNFIQYLNGTDPHKPVSGRELMATYDPDLGRIKWGIHK